MKMACIPTLKSLSNEEMEDVYLTCFLYGLQTKVKKVTPVMHGKVYQ